MAQKIERVDTIPLVIAILKKMGVQEIIDSIFIPHGNWPGLSYGQLAVLFITYVLHSLTHRFSGVESWVNQHRTVIELATGWQVGEKIGDCKAAAYETRVAIDHGKGCYLFPLPMTDETPRHIEEFVLNPEQELQDIVLAPRQDQDDEDRVVGKGFVVDRQMETRFEDGTNHQWRERWMVSRSDAHAKHREKSFQSRIALQVLTLMAFVSRRELAKKDESISGLVPGNPKMKTKRPTTERLLSQFDNLHLLVEEKGKKVSVTMVETLTALQKRILSVLQLPEKIYELSFKHGLKKIDV